MSENENIEVEKAEVTEIFEDFKEYELKYPYTLGKKVIKDLKIEIPNGHQLLRIQKKETEIEVIACIVSQCCVNHKLTENQVLEFKSRDLTSLSELLADFL